MNPTTKVIFALCVSLLCITSEAANTYSTKDYTIVNTYVRTGTRYYTEGLLFLDPNTLIESSGNYGKSGIEQIAFPSMEVLKSETLKATYFGEGIGLHTVNGVERVYQMTWKEKKVFAWKASDLSYITTINFPTVINQGWGLTKGQRTVNGVTSEVFYISNGSAYIYIVDPDTWKVLGSILVRGTNGVTVNQLNELEWINGKIWANVYMTNNVLIIDPTTGYIQVIVDFSNLQTLAQTQATKMGLTMQRDYVLNGIAYDATNDRVIMTGKMWPLMWEIKVNGI